MKMKYFMKNVYFLLMSENECKMKKFYKKDVKVENNKKKTGFKTSLWNQIGFQNSFNVKNQFN